MEPATQGSGAPVKSTSRQNRTLQAVLLFFLLLLIVLILALTTGTLGNKTTVSNSNTSPNASAQTDANSKVLSNGTGPTTLSGTSSAQEQSQQAAAAMTPAGVTNTGQSANSSGSSAVGSATLPAGNNSAAGQDGLHLGNYVCATGTAGNLTYHSDFTLLSGGKYKHSTNPSQEYAFAYNSATQTVTWLAGPNTGLVGTYHLPDGTHPYRIIAQSKNNSQPVLTCTLAEK
ncbi:MAG: hypothetical protein JWP00_1971 [Chloroflexi bacterium]|jgi:hypothetical protein|nr:hypothetical protein [Chloroflexota bacterium]